MGWSTREIAELAGTTLRAVRHYHDTGLLEEPEREDNGYKQYGLRDLLRLLRIRRLVDLGFTLPQIAAMADVAEEGHSPPDLERLDRELAARIEQLQSARREIDTIRSRGGQDPLLGAGLSETAARSLRSADRDFLTILARLASPEVLEAYLAMVEAAHADPLLAELDDLPPDATEQRRADLADRLVAHNREVHGAHPVLRDVVQGSRLQKHVAGAALRAAIEELYNPAQVDVVRRLGAALT